MEYGNWLGWQIDYLLYLQNFRDVSHHIFDNFFIYITLFGELTIPIILICIIYWCINKRTGQFILSSWLAGFTINILAKVTACIYRPWILDCRVHPLPQSIPAATGYSFPSGHTSGVVSVWGATALSYWNKKWLRYLCFAIIVCVMVSRNYLGVHTPQDVIVSFILTALIILVMHKIMSWVEAGESKENRDLIFAGGLTTLVILTMCYMWFKSYPIHYLFGKILYDPEGMKLLELSRSGFFFGAIIGWLVERRFVGYDPNKGSLLSKIIKTVLGLSVIVGLCSAMPAISETFGTFGKFIQMGIIGLFITGIYPFLLKKLINE